MVAPSYLRPDASTFAIDTVAPLVVSAGHPSCGANRGAIIARDEYPIGGTSRQRFLLSGDGPQAANGSSQAPGGAYHPDCQKTKGKWRRVLSAVCVLLAIGPLALAAETGHDLAALERSFWVHASLGTAAQRGYWGPAYAASPPPSESEIRNAAKLLTGVYGANRLYLVYHGEIAWDDARRVFLWWRQHCPESVSLVPTLVARMYDKQQTPVFDRSEVRRMAEFFQGSVHRQWIAVYDVYPNRDLSEAAEELASRYPGGLIRVGIQPEEKIAPPYVGAVQDTWSGLCHGKTNVDWLDRGFGAETLRVWIAQRNRQERPVAWNLIAVAWDYSVTERGGYPGYDDAGKNMPLPEGRNRLAVREILREARPGRLAGFSSDLLILEANSQHPARDGPRASFYATLKRGEPYRGYFGVPFEEIAAIFRELKAGRRPGG